eukprot:251619-Chlamydomonas_euryale.AAC.2
MHGGIRKQRLASYLVHACAAAGTRVRAARMRMRRRTPAACMCKRRRTHAQTHARHTHAHAQMHARRAHVHAYTHARRMHAHAYMHARRVHAHAQTHAPAARTFDAASRRAPLLSSSSVQSLKPLRAVHCSAVAPTLLRVGPRGRG